jgi:hypothetical protein
VVLALSLGKYKSDEASCGEEGRVQCRRGNETAWLDGSKAAVAAADEVLVRGGVAGGLLKPNEDAKTGLLERLPRLVPSKLPLLAASFGEAAACRSLAYCDDIVSVVLMGGSVRPYLLVIALLLSE